MTKLTDPGGWTVLDLFSGQGRISQLAAKLGIKTLSVDINIPGADSISRMVRRKAKRKFPGPRRNLMDINGHTGFLFLGFI